MNEYLTFWLGTEYYGIDILTVQEIRTYGYVTTIPNLPQHIKGVMNLRGLIIPIIDMRLKFGMTNITYNDMTVVIIIKVYDKTIGIVVDAVEDVVHLQPAQIQPPPSLHAVLNIEYIEGLVSLDKLMLVILNITQLIANEEIKALEPVVNDGDTIKPEV